MTETVYTVALAGNPNVGKSTLFNALTGLNQHTGNWAGKTVDVARGRFSHRGAEYRLIDLPGMCSMKSDSAEEKLARDFIAFEPIDAAVVVADATSLERGIRLTLEVMEATPRVLLCVNLMDEAAKKGIRVNIPKLHEKLGIPVVPMSANQKKGIREFKDALRAVIALPDPSADAPLPETLLYDTETENALMYLQPYLAKAPGTEHALCPRSACWRAATAPPRRWRKKPWSRRAVTTSISVTHSRHSRQARAASSAGWRAKTLKKAPRSAVTASARPAATQTATGG